MKSLQVLQRQLQETLDLKQYWTTEIFLGFAKVASGNLGSKTLLDKGNLFRFCKGLQLQETLGSKSILDKGKLFRFCKGLQLQETLDLKQYWTKEKLIFCHKLKFSNSISLKHFMDTFEISNLHYLIYRILSLKYLGYTKQNRLQRYRDYKLRVGRKHLLKVEDVAKTFFGTAFEIQSLVGNPIFIYFVDFSRIFKQILQY